MLSRPSCLVGAGGTAPEFQVHVSLQGIWVNEKPFNKNNKTLVSKKPGKSESVNELGINLMVLIHIASFPCRDILFY